MKNIDTAPLALGITADIDPVENPDQYRAALYKAGIISDPAPPEVDADELKAAGELKDERKGCRDDRGRVCRLNKDGSKERVHFSQQIIVKGGKLVSDDIHMPGENWKDSRGAGFTLTPTGTIVCTDIRVKGKANKKALKREKMRLRAASVCGAETCS
jgi:hypothetical protein